MVKEKSDTTDKVRRSKHVKDVYTWEPKTNSKFTPSAQKVMEKLYKKGFTDVEVADFLEVGSDVITKWKLKHTEFFGKVLDWKDEADRKVERALYERAIGYSHPEEKLMNVSQGKDAGSMIERHDTIKHYPPDTKACEFWLKNRRGKHWKEKQEIELTGVDTMSDEQIKREAEKILNGKK